MVKRVLLLAFGVVYLATAFWLVHSRADSYRAALRERRTTRLALLPRAHPVPPTTTTATPPQPMIPDSRPQVSAQPLAMTTRPAPITTPGPAPIPKPYESPVKLQPLVIAGLENASAADEAMFGDALNKLVLVNHPAVQDGSAQQRAILDAVQPLIDLRERKDIEITITVLDSDEVNAFSHMGGYLYVTRGLLSLAGTEEEFLFVIGHELAHIEKKHGQELVNLRTRDGTIARVGTLQALYHQIAEGYTEAQELAADDWVIDRMLKLDHTTRECLMYLRKLRRLSDELKFREGHRPSPTPAEASVQDVANHIRSQPAAYRRLARLEARLNATPAPKLQP